jgi:hypothetical protein
MEIRLIDDMELDRPNLPPLPLGSSGFFYPSGPGTLGNWFVSAADGKLRDAEVAEIQPPRETSQRACHLSGAADARGLDLWAQLDHPSYRPVNLSGHRAMTFWARSGVPDARVTIAIAQSQRSIFQPGTAADRWEQIITVGDWQQFTLSFDDFHRADDAGPANKLDPAAVFAVHFLAGRDGQAVDLWIDDFSLVCNGACRKP